MTIQRALLEQIGRLHGPLRNRIANLIARSVVTRVNDAPKLQELQLGILADESRDECEHFQTYGFSSIPLPGAEAVALFPNGDRGVALVIAVDDRRYRPKGGQGGESVMYTDEGDEIRLARGHVIVMTTSGQIKAGSAAAADPVALSSELAALKAIIAGWMPVSGDGGASLKALISAWAVPGSTKLKTE